MCVCVYVVYIMVHMHHWISHYPLDISTSSREAVPPSLETIGLGGHFGKLLCIFWIAMYIDTYCDWCNESWTLADCIASTAQIKANMTLVVSTWPVVYCSVTMGIHTFSIYSITLLCISPGSPGRLNSVQWWKQGLVS